jgi:hypothetical protein
MASIVTNTKRTDPSVAAMIDAYIAAKGVTRADAAVARGSKQPRTKHLNHPNYGMKNRRYA